MKQRDFGTLASFGIRKPKKEAESYGGYFGTLASFGIRKLEMNKEPVPSDFGTLASFGIRKQCDGSASWR